MPFPGAPPDSRPRRWRYTVGPILEGSPGDHRLLDPGVCDTDGHTVGSAEIPAYKPKTARLRGSRCDAKEALKAHTGFELEPQAGSTAVARTLRWRQTRDRRRARCAVSSSGAKADSNPPASWVGTRDGSLAKTSPDCAAPDPGRFVGAASHGPGDGDLSGVGRAPSIRMQGYARPRAAQACAVSRNGAVGSFARQRSRSSACSAGSSPAT